MSTEHPTPAVPAGMVAVSKEDFFKALYADKRDIMPTTKAREHTPWRVVQTRAMWGWCSTGYASKYGAPEVYAITKAAGLFDEDNALMMNASDAQALRGAS